MDNKAAAKLLPRLPQHADDELPAPAAEGSGCQRTLSATRLRVITVLALISDYLRIVSKNLSDQAWRVRAHEDDAAGDKLPLPLWHTPALLALAYAVVAALIWFIGRLERRRLLQLQPADDRDDDARWERRVKLAAQFLVHAIIGVLVGYSSSMTPLAFFVFMWVKPGDQVYIKVQKEEENDEEKQCQV